MSPQYKLHYQNGKTIGVMKLHILTFLSIALIIQVCSCGNPARVKRSAYVKENLEELIHFAKTVVNDSGAMVTAVIDAMPNTEDYNQFREQLQAYLRRLANYRTYSGICATKSLEIMVAFLDVALSYEDEKASTEAKEVHKLLNDNGLEALEKEADKWMESFDYDKFKNEYENLTRNENTAMSPMFTEIC